MTRIGATLAAIALAGAQLVALAADVPQGLAEALRERYAASQAEASPFGLPLALDSAQQDGTLHGDIDSRLDAPFAIVREALRQPARWCEIMILHPNVKGCRAGAMAADGSGTLDVRVGRAQHAASFAFRVVHAQDDYLDVRLEAPVGPAGTTDYRIRVQAAPLDSRHTVLHLAYSHGFGTRAKVAMNTYFATFGRDKVGFSVTGRDAQGRPQYVRDLRGGLERNAMRYYLAIRSYVDALDEPPTRILELALQRYIGYTQRWPLQLAEEPDYAAVKRRDFANVGTAR